MPGRVLGIDYGDRRFGLAVCDLSRTLARPLRVCEGEEALYREIAEYRRDEEVSLAVLGLPLNMDGTMGPKAHQVLAFRDRFTARTGLPVEMWDERLTTVQAEDALRERGIRGARRRATVDAIAARILLQSWLDRPIRE